MRRLSQFGILAACASLATPAHAAFSFGWADKVLSVVSSADGSGTVFAFLSPPAFDPDAHWGVAGTCRWDGLRPAWSRIDMDATRGVDLLAASPIGHRVVNGYPSGQATLTFISSAGVATPLVAPITPGSQPVAAVNDAGFAAVAWIDNRRTLRVAAFDGTRWVTAHADADPTASVDGDPFSTLRVAIARNGTAIVGGTTGEETSSSVFGWQYSPQRGWERQPQIFARHTVSTRMPPGVAVRVSGAASVSWAGSDGRVVVANRGVDGRWTGPQVIATERPRSVVTTDLVFDPSGRALVAWTAYDRRITTRTRLASFRWAPRATLTVPRASVFNGFSLGANNRGIAAVMAVVPEPLESEGSLPVNRTLTGLVAKPGKAYVPTSTIVVARSRQETIVLSAGPVSVSDRNTFVTAWIDPSGSSSPDYLSAACGRVPLR